MKLQKNFAYKYKDKKHFKHVLVIPEGVVKELGWNTGEELKQEIAEGTLVIKPTTTPLERKNSANMPDKKGRVRNGSSV